MHIARTHNEVNVIPHQSYFLLLLFICSNWLFLFSVSGWWTTGYDHKVDFFRVSLTNCCCRLIRRIFQMPTRFQFKKLHLHACIRKKINMTFIWHLWNFSINRSDFVQSSTRSSTFPKNCYFFDLSSRRKKCYFTAQWNWKIIFN